MNGFETGRYRLEAVLHDQLLITFGTKIRLCIWFGSFIGGGAPDFVAEFNEVRTFYH